MEDQARTASSINVVAGLWLIAAPFVLHYASAANKWQEVMFGIVIALLGLIRLDAPRMAWPSWINALIGIWLIVAPWIISNTTTSARWNEVIVGSIVAFLAWVSAAITVSMHHHRPHVHA